MSKESIENFKYTKDDGATSDRKLFVVQNVPAANIKALDLSQFDDETAKKIAFLYSDWLKNIKKPFDKLAKKFMSDNLVSFDDHLKGSGLYDGTDTLLKAFKEKNLAASPE